MRKPGPKVFWLVLGVVAFNNLLLCDSSAQSYPGKPVRMLVGFAAGGGADVVARIVMQKLSENVGQPVIIENRPGAGSAISIERAAKSPADGYTLVMITSSGVAQSALRANLPYDLKRDFEPVSAVAIGPYLLVVHPSVPARNVKDLIALARSRPGQLSYGSSGAGSTPHFTGELLNLMANVRIVHVPYKGGAENAVATASGQIEMCYASIPAALPLLNAGKLRALAVTSAKRASFMSSIPTLDESGLPGYDLYSWYGVLAPAGAPKDAIARLNAAIDKIISSAEMKESFNKLGLDVQTSAPDQFGAFIQRELAKSIKLVKLAGMKPE